MQRHTFDTTGVQQPDGARSLGKRIKRLIEDKIQETFNASRVDEFPIFTEIKSSTFLGHVQNISAQLAFTLKIHPLKFQIEIK